MYHAEESFTEQSAEKGILCHLRCSDTTVTNTTGAALRMIQWPAGATEGSSKTEGPELNASPTTQAFTLHKLVNQEHICAQIHLSSRAVQHLPYIACQRKKSMTGEILIQEKERKTDEWRRHPDSIQE